MTTENHPHSQSLPRKKIDPSFVLILILFVAVGVASWSLFFKEYTQTDTVNIHNFPKQVNEWSSKDLIITEEEYAILETRNAFVRNYTNAADESIHLFLVYSQNNRKVSHPPEICYTGSGIDVLENHPAQIDLAAHKVNIDANKLLLEQGNVEQVSYYWFKVGNSFTRSYWKQQVLIAIKTLFGKPASSALVRISSTIQNNDEGRAVRSIENFAQEIYPLLMQYLP